MGGQVSNLFIPDVPYLVCPKHCLITFPAQWNSDEIVLLYGDEDIFRALREVISRTWSKGIDKEKEYANFSGGFKLNGRPFGSNTSNSSRHSIAVANLMCGVVEMMMNRGWRLIGTINFIREQKSDSFLFVQEKCTDVEPRVVALDLGSSDQIHLVRLPSRLGKVMEELVKQHWPAGLSNVKIYPGGDDMKLVTKRYPWRATLITDNLSNSRSMLLSLIRAVHREGYLLIASGHPQNSIEEVDTLFFAPVREAPPNVFIFGVQKHDYLYTVDAPEMCTSIVRNAILSTWPQGIDKEETIDDMWAVKTKGYPWQTSGKNAVNSRRLINKILQDMLAVGWRVLATVDTTKDIGDVSCFVMAACEPQRRRFMSLKMSGNSNLRLVDTPLDVAQAIKASIGSVWPEGFSEKESENGVTLKFKKKLTDCQGIICFVMDALAAKGWHLLSSADLSVKYYADKNTRFPLDLHTMIFEEIGEMAVN